MTTTTKTKAKAKRRTPPRPLKFAPSIKNLFKNDPTLLPKGVVVSAGYTQKSDLWLNQLFDRLVKKTQHVRDYYKRERASTKDVKSVALALLASDPDLAKATTAFAEACVQRYDASFA